MKNIISLVNRSLRVYSTPSSFNAGWPCVRNHGVNHVLLTLLLPLNALSIFPLSILSRLQPLSLHYLMCALQGWYVIWSARPWLQPYIPRSNHILAPTHKPSILLSYQCSNIISKQSDSTAITYLCQSQFMQKLMHLLQNFIWII